MPEPKYLVRCKRTHRIGLVDAVVAPPRAGRDLLVIWQGGIDYSLMSRAEVDLETGTPLEHFYTLPSSVLDHPKG